MLSKKQLRWALEQPASTRIALYYKSSCWVDHFCVFVSRLPPACESNDDGQIVWKCWNGILSGIDFIVKDSIDVVGFPTTNGSKVLNNNYPLSDHLWVARLRSLGGICVGKANLDEMSYGWSSSNPYFGQVINPAHPNHSPGGSSGGCAAGVAGGAAYFAVGEDTVGSLRIPAAFCGVSAYRAAHRGPVPDGVCPLTSSGYDQLGLIANTLGDISLLDSLIHEYKELPSVDANDLYIAVAANFTLANVESSIEESMHEVIFKLSSAGAHIVMCEVPASFDLAAHALTTIVNHEFLEAFNRYLDTRVRRDATLEDLLENRNSAAVNRIKALAFPPGRPSGPVYERAKAVATEIKQDVVDYFSSTQCQVLIHPTVGITVPALSIYNESLTDSLALTRHVSVASCAQTTAMNFSVVGAEALPVGIEMLCSPEIDPKQLFAICRTIETIVKG